MTDRTATGTFTVRMEPDAPEQPHAGGVRLGSMALHKQFAGDLLATGQGRMLTAMGGVAGSAGYVAIEHVEGTLHGRSGGFAFLHRGVMGQGAQELSITVVPDTGSGALAGIAGRFELQREGDLHRYTFHYTLPDAAA